MGRHRELDWEQIDRLRGEGLTQRKIAAEMGIPAGSVASACHYMDARRVIPSHAPSARFGLEVRDGVVLVGSDAHYWPEDKTPIPAAHRAFVRACSEFAPAAIILNGDIVDGSRVSRWDAQHWVDYGSRPTVAEEIGTCQARLREIEKAAPPLTPLLWTLGNHDSRVERYLIQAAPEIVGVMGTRLKDHFEDWTPAMSVLINDGPDAVMVKHRFKSGPYAPRNNTMQAGVHMVTGHLHSQKCIPFTDYRGTRYGVDSGMLGSPYGMQDLYAEDNPLDWRAGFAVLTFRDGRLMMPEFVYVIEEAAGLVGWRGEIWEV